MKAAAFDLAVPAGLDDAATLLAKPLHTAMAGGQSLGPMLNFRAARPAAIVPLSHLAALQGVEETPEFVTLGAATTHAAIADGRTPDLPGGILARIAAGIAYRAVRNRGTIGGSLCHADPAADWLTTLLALDAAVLTNRRALALDGFVLGPYRTALDQSEIVRAVRIPRPPAGFAWAYEKFCRKPGEFAHAMAAAMALPDGTARLAIGAQAGRPLLLRNESATLAAASEALAALDAVSRRMHLAVVDRALAELAR